MDRNDVQTALSKARWEQMKELFMRCVEAETDAKFVGHHTPLVSETALLADVQKLVLHYRAARLYFSQLRGGLPLEPFLDQTVEPGSTLGGRFRIIHLLARGGMGEVYEAEDLELGGRVAVKTLRQAIAQQPGSLEQFRAEVKLARRVQSRFVCQVLDVGRHQEPGEPPYMFFSMELLAGETLAARLKREGPWTAKTVAPFTMQLLEGIAAAHRAQVIHRDLKPANIMLCPSLDGDRAVITDFGLSCAARMGVEDDGQSSPRGLTPVYAAPEQLKGEPETPATDIYSLGIVLYEMLTGCLPFRGETAWEISQRRLTTAPIPMRVVQPGIPRRWDKAVLRCLEQDPANRWSSPAELRAALGLQERSQWQWPLAVAAVVGVAGIWLVPPRANSDVPMGAALPPGAVVYVPKLTNRSGDPRGGALDTLFRRQVEQSARVTLLGEEEANAARKAMGFGPNSPVSEAAVREVALRNRASLVVLASVSPVGNGYALEIELENLGDKPSYAAARWKRSFPFHALENAAEPVRQAAAWVRAAIGEPAQQIVQASRPPEQVTTSSWPALEAYRTAEKWADERQPALAMASLRQAIQIDPQFALAEMRLADLLVVVRKWSEGFQHYRRAMELAAQGRLTRREELLLKGNYLADSGDPAAAESALREFVREYPSEYKGPFLLANTLREQARFTEALEQLWAADRKRPNASNVIGNLAMTYTILGKTDQVREMAQRFQSTGSFDDHDMQEGIAYAVRKQTGKATALFEKVAHARDPDLASRAFSRWAQALAEADQLPQAEGVLRLGIERDRQSANWGQLANKEAALAFLALRSGARDDTRRLCWDAAAANPTTLLLSRLAVLLSWAGHLPDARRMRSQLQALATDIPIDRAALLRVDGEIALAEGRTRKGVSLLEQLDRQETPLAHRLYMARAYRLLNEPARARERCTGLAHTPGLFWFYTDFDLPSLPAYLCGPN